MNLEGENLAETQLFRPYSSNPRVYLQETLSLLFVTNLPTTTDHSSYEKK